MRCAVLALALTSCSWVTAEHVAAVGGAGLGGCVDGLAYAAAEAVIDKASAPAVDAGLVVDAGEDLGSCSYCRAHGWSEPAGCFGARRDCEGDGGD